MQGNVAAVYRFDGLGDRPSYLRLDLIDVFNAHYALQNGTSLAGGAAQWSTPGGFFIGLEQVF